MITLRSHQQTTRPEYISVSPISPCASWTVLFVFPTCTDQMGVPKAPLLRLSSAPDDNFSKKLLTRCIILISCGPIERRKDGSSFIFWKVHLGHYRICRRRIDITYSDNSAMACNFWARSNLYFCMLGSLPPIRFRTAETSIPEASSTMRYLPPGLTFAMFSIWDSESIRRSRIRLISFANQYSQTLNKVGSIVLNDLENLRSEILFNDDRRSLNRRGILCFLALLVLVFAVFCLQRIVCMKLNLLLYYVLESNNDQIVKRFFAEVRTDACTPDCFRASISIVVRGWTNWPSFMSSFVASVSSCSHISRRGCHSDGKPTKIFHCLGRKHGQVFASDFMR